MHYSFWKINKNCRNGNPGPYKILNALSVIVAIALFFHSVYTWKSVSNSTTLIMNVHKLLTFIFIICYECIGHYDICFLPLSDTPFFHIVIFQQASVTGTMCIGTFNFRLDYNLYQFLWRHTHEVIHRYSSIRQTSSYCTITTPHPLIESWWIFNALLTSQSALGTMLEPLVY